MNRDKVRMALKTVLKEAPFSMRQLANEAGVSYGALRGWAIGRRVPDRETVEQIAAALRDRSTRFAQLADDLEREAQSTD